MAGTKQDAAPALTGVETAPETYVDGFQGVAFRQGGNVKVNFFSDRSNPASDDMIRRCVLVMTMTPLTMVQIHHAIGGMIEKLQAEGVLEVVENDAGAGVEDEDERSTT